MSLIRVYNVGSMTYTPFGGFHPLDLPFLNQKNIVITENITEADILVSQNIRKLRPYFFRYAFSKKFMIWTNEPRFNTTASQINSELFGLIKCHIMNIYNGEVYKSTEPLNAKYFQEKTAKLPLTFKLKDRKTIALISYYKGLDTEKILIDGEDVDLIKKTYKNSVVRART